MWLSEKVAGNSAGSEPIAEIGRITVGGAAPGALAGSEKRGLGVLCPGGYTWTPQAGQDVLIISTDDGENLIAGELLPGGPGTEGGEVRISAPGGAEIYLKNDGGISVKGRIKLEGNAEIEGDISVSGIVDIRGALFLNGVQIVPGMGI